MAERIEGLGMELQACERATGSGVGERIAPTTTRSDPPPKHKNNNEPQPYDIRREIVAVRGGSSGSSARLGKSSSVGPYSGTGVRQLGRAAHAERWLEAIAPETLPPGAERIVSHAWTKWYRVRLEQPLQVILEVECWSGELWAHLAVTGRSNAPTLGELGWCKNVFLGDRKAVQIFPRRTDAAAAAGRTLHLYSPLESDPLPSFPQREPIASEAP